MVLELGRALSFFLSILSLYPALVSAFFVPGAEWKDRLAAAFLNVGFAGCVALASGLIFSWPAPANPDAGRPLLSTLPVRVFLWALGGMAILFLVSLYLEIFFVPQLRHDCCRP